MKITFLGATRTVTGSNILVETKTKKFEEVSDFEKAKQLFVGISTKRIYGVTYQNRMDKKFFINIYSLRNIRFFFFSPIASGIRNLIPIMLTSIKSQTHILNS